jgi:TolB-like protein
MRNSAKAIFLSYASQDAEAARRICDSLRAAGLEVWYDRSELRGGDAWDASIRNQIKECALFIPIISRNTEARTEGYFRLEWRLADQRTHLMAKSRAFLVPVCIDDTRDVEAEAPDSFSAVQWTLLRDGNAPLAFVERISRLLSPDERLPAIPGRRPVAEPPVMDVLPALGTIPQTSIAVLPFTNLTNEAEKEYFSDGLAEELIHILTSVPGLKVPARTSSFAYKGRNTDIRQIAKDLGVATVLEGSVRSAGERIRVTAQLVNAQTGFHVWSQTYDRRYDDIFKLQDELAGAILQALQINLGGQSAVTVLPQPPTPNIEAYQLYLQGRALVQRSGRDSTQAGIRLLEKAIAIDPTFGRAYAAIAQAQNYSVSIGASTANLLSEVERNAQRALALDAAISEAYASLTYVSTYRAHWLDAEQHYRKAIALNPEDPLIHIYYGQLLLPTTGRVRAALRASQEAYRLAPAMPIAAMGIAVASAYLDRDSDVLAYTQLAVDLGMPRSTPPLPFMDAAVSMNAGRYAEAAEHMNSVLAPVVLEAGGAAVVGLVYAAAAGAGDKRAAVEALLALRAGAAREAMVRPIMVMLSTVWFTRLGALDLAYELAHAALHEFETTRVLPGAIHVGTCWLPEMRPFRQDPRFQTYVTRLGLMEYWKQYGPPDDCELKDGKLTCY